MSDNDVDELIASFSLINDPLGNLAEQFAASVQVKENIDILCAAIEKEDYIMDDIENRLTDEFLYESDSRLQLYSQCLGEFIKDTPIVDKKLERYLNISDRFKKFKLLVLIDQYILREVIKYWDSDELENYLMEIVKK
jgi:hypothetical protein